LVAIPLVIWVEVLGFTRFEPVNAILAILGFFSLGVVLVNLIPIPPLDGATAWGLIPALIDRAKLNKRKTPMNWRR
jgi:Zn-dependent protease